MILTREEIIAMLSLEGNGMHGLFERSQKVKHETVGRKTYLRGLVEISNNCRKNCLYCGIRRENRTPVRYELDTASILDAVRFAYDSGYGSVVLQAGENTSPGFINKIEDVIRKIVCLGENRPAITLSLGEQSFETYRRWREAGADRYLLRIETSNVGLYRKIHPRDDLHRYHTRLDALHALRRLDYQVGTGVMIGLPFQTVEDLADDLLFMQKIDIDMCGMGPYIEHPETPLIQYADELKPLKDRFLMTLKMIAVLRLLMPDINIAATTALQAIDPLGREKALEIGANVMMPNITPGHVRSNYKLYQNKPCTDDAPEECNDCAIQRIGLSGDEVMLGEHGNPAHYVNRK